MISGSNIDYILYNIYLVNKLGESRGFLLQFTRTFILQTIDRDPANTDSYTFLCVWQWTGAPTVWEKQHVRKSVQDQGHRGGWYLFHTFDPSQNIPFFLIACFFLLICKAVFGWWQLWEFWNPSCTMGAFSDFSCLVIHLKQHMESE